MSVDAIGVAAPPNLLYVAYHLVLWDSLLGNMHFEMSHKRTSRVRLLSKTIADRYST
jgi:hypothetical protein